MLFEPIKDDLEFEDFVVIYEQDIYIAYMETGCSYEMELEHFEELEYEDYLQGHGQWARTPKQPLALDPNITLGEKVS